MSQVRGAYTIHETMTGQKTPKISNPMLKLSSTIVAKNKEMMGEVVYQMKRKMRLMNASTGGLSISVGCSHLSI